MKISLEFPASSLWSLWAKRRIRTATVHGTQSARFDKLGTRHKLRLGFRVSGSGFGVSGLGLGAFRVSGFWLRVWGLFIEPQGYLPVGTVRVGVD